MSRLTKVPDRSAERHRYFAKTAALLARMDVLDRVGAIEKALRAAFAAGRRVEAPAAPVAPKATVLVPKALYPVLFVPDPTMPPDTFEIRTRLETLRVHLDEDGDWKITASRGVTS